jgi:hypothetical protein
VRAWSEWERIAAGYRALIGRTGLSAGVGDGDIGGCTGHEWADPERCKVGRAPDEQ